MPYSIFRTLKFIGQPRRKPLIFRWLSTCASQTGSTVSGLFVYKWNRQVTLPSGDNQLPTDLSRRLKSGEKNLKPGIALVKRASQSSLHDKRKPLETVLLGLQQKTRVFLFNNTCLFEKNTRVFDRQQV
jgi:hypothetical protein